MDVKDVAVFYIHVRSWIKIEKSIDQSLNVSSSH